MDLAVLTLVGEASEPVISLLRGGIFSLLESPSWQPMDVLARFGLGVESGVGSWTSHDFVGVASEASCC